MTVGMAKPLPGTGEGAPGQRLPGEGVAIVVRPDMGVVDGGTGDGKGEGAEKTGPPGALAVDAAVGDWVAARATAPAVRMTVTAPMD